MILIKNRIFYFLIIMSSIVLINFICIVFTASADNTQIIIDENLRPGMTLKDAIELLGPPERIKTGENGTIIIPYNKLGLSIEVMNDGATVDCIHLHSSFKGRFASGLEMGADYQKILSAYNQPDIMTKDAIDYSDMARRFHIQQGKLVGADLHSGKSTLYHKVASIETGRHKDIKTPVYKTKDNEQGKETENNEDEETGVDEEFNVFDLYGFYVKHTFDGLIITKVIPASFAEKGGLKVGEPVRKAFYKGALKLNIFSESGLKAILKRAIEKRKKNIYILQSAHRYYKVEVPERR